MPYLDPDKAYSVIKRWRGRNAELHTDEWYAATGDDQVLTCARCSLTGRAGDKFSRDRGTKNGFRLCKPCNTRHIADWKYRQRYNLTSEQRVQLWIEAGHKCEICAKQLARDEFHVDHCHQHGHVRGVLCPGCNQALGMMRDSPDLLKKAADYLLSRNPKDKPI